VQRLTEDYHYREMTGDQFWLLFRELRPLVFGDTFTFRAREAISKVEVLAGDIPIVVFPVITHLAQLMVPDLVGYSSEYPVDSPSVGSLRFLTSIDDLIFGFPEGKFQALLPPKVGTAFSTSPPN
jgi:hypothetical protein